MASSSMRAGSVQMTFTRVLVAACAFLAQDPEATAARDRATLRDRLSPRHRPLRPPAAALRVRSRPNPCACQSCRYTSASEAEVRAGLSAFRPIMPARRSPVAASGSRSSPAPGSPARAREPAAPAAPAGLQTPAATDTPSLFTPDNAGAHPTARRASSGAGIHVRGGPFHYGVFGLDRLGKISKQSAGSSPGRNGGLK